MNLYQREDKYWIRSEPVKEIESLLEPSEELESLTDSTFLIQLETVGDFKVTLANDLAEEVVLTLINDTLTFDRSQSGRTDFDPSFPGIHRAGVEDMEVADVKIFVDLSSIEVFVNNGELVMTKIVFPSTPYQSILFDGGITASTIQPIKSVW
ncbi:MAG: GH32 C-terminal domain-containing protein [Bacteroidota bacterium]